MVPDTTPEAGWYPDPTDAGQLRLWDGESWTARTKPWAPLPPLPEPPSAQPRNPQPLDPDPSRRTRRIRIAVEGAGLGLVMLMAGFPALPSWGSPARPSVGSPRRDSTSPSTAGAVATGPTTLPAAVTVDCRLAAARPGAARVVEWFATHGLAAKASSPPPDLPPGACGVGAFTDTHAPGTNLVIVYPDERAAEAGAAKAPPSPGLAPLFVRGIYVVGLESALVDQRGPYQAALASYVSASNPAAATSPATSTTTTRPPVRSGGSRSRGSGQG